MAYEITYHMAEKVNAHRFWVYGIAAIFLLSCIQWQGLLPESAAISDLIDNLRAGESITDAVSVFCQELMTHGR